MMIEDGTGNGFKAEVDEKHHLHVRANVISILEELNEEDGAVWELPIDGVAPSGATKFIYLLNNNTTLMGVAGIRIASSVAGVFRFVKVTGTAAGGTTVTPVPCNLGSTVPAPAGAQSGASITGLTDAGLLLPMYIQANVFTTLELPARWYLPPNTALAIQAPAAATVNGCLLIFSE